MNDPIPEQAILRKGEFEAELIEYKVYWSDSVPQASLSAMVKLHNKSKVSTIMIVTNRVWLDNVFSRYVKDMPEYCNCNNGLFSLFANANKVYSDAVVSPIDSNGRELKYADYFTMKPGEIAYLDVGFNMQYFIYYDTRGQSIQAKEDFIRDYLNKTVITYNICLQYINVVLAKYPDQQIITNLPLFRSKSFSIKSIRFPRNPKH